MLKLEFFSRRTNTEGELGAHIRVNTKNGNFKLSPTVAQKANIGKSDRLNFSYVPDKDGNIEQVYMALEDRGLTIGEGNTFSSTTHGTDMKAAFAGQMEPGHTILILGVDLDNPIKAETDKGEVTAYALSFLESQKAKASSKDGEEIEEEEAAEVEV